MVRRVGWSCEVRRGANVNDLAGKDVWSLAEDSGRLFESLVRFSNRCFE